MGEPEDDWDEIDLEDWERREDERALSPAGIAGQNDGLLRRYREFRHAADLPLPDNDEGVEGKKGAAAAPARGELTPVTSRGSITPHGDDLPARFDACHGCRRISGPG